MDLQQSVFNNLVFDVATLPEVKDAQLSLLYHMPVVDIKAIRYSPMFRDAVTEKAEELRKTSNGDELKSLQERLEESAQLVATSRILEEINNYEDGTPTTRVQAAKAAIDMKKREENQSFLAIELSPDKFRAIIGNAKIPTEMPEHVRG